MAPTTQSPHALRKIQKRLKLLQCPLPLGLEDSTLRWTQLARVVVWLEDRVIRHDPIDAREQLRDVADEEQWILHLNEYLTRLSCPLLAEFGGDNAVSSKSSKSMMLRERSLVAVVLWLTAHAVSLEFEENVDEITPSQISSPDATSQSCSSEVLRALRALYEATQAAQAKGKSSKQKSSNLTGNQSLSKEHLEHIIETITSV